MCKLAAITGPLDKVNAEWALDVINADFAPGQRDGFGYYMLGEPKANGKGPRKAYGRFLKPDEFYGHKSSLPDFIQSGAHFTSGNVPDNVTCLMAHGRTGTGTGGTVLKNVHPFKNQTLVMAHNGMLYWEGKGAAPYSAAGCDSESFLTWLASGGTWEQAHNAWSGWGAILLMDVSTRSLTVAKDYSTRLHGARRREGGWILATEASLVQALGRRIPLCTKVAAFPRRIVQFNPEGEIAHDCDWNGFGSRAYNIHSQQALGYTPGKARAAVVTGDTDIDTTLAGLSKKERKILAKVEAKRNAANEQKTIGFFQSTPVVGQAASDACVTGHKARFPDYDPRTQGAWCD